MQKENKEVRVTAKTTDLALKEAATLLDASVDELGHRIISQTNGGFFSFLAKKVEIAAWRQGASSGRSKPATSRGRSRPQSQPTRSEAVREKREDLTASELNELTEDLRAFCEGICSKMSDGDVKVTAELNDRRLVLDIDDEYIAQQIAKNSKLAESLEHVLRKKPRHLKRELPFRIFVDVKGVRRGRETDLVELAQDLSEKVHENRRPIVLNYKSSYDRKIIHMALDKDDRVYTKSIGTGPNRKLMILPIKKQGDEVSQEPYEELGVD